MIIETAMQSLLRSGYRNRENLHESIHSDGPSKIYIGNIENCRPIVLATAIAKTFRKLNPILSILAQGIWPSYEDKFALSAIIKNLGGAGDPLIENGFVFNESEYDGLRSILNVGIYSGWDMFIGSSGSDWAFFSHDGYAVLKIEDASQVDSHESGGRYETYEFSGMRR